MLFQSKAHIIGCMHVACREESKERGSTLGVGSSGAAPQGRTSPQGGMPPPNGFGLLQPGGGGADMQPVNEVCCTIYSWHASCSHAHYCDPATAIRIACASRSKETLAI